MVMGRPKKRKRTDVTSPSQFQAERAYAESIFRQAIGDMDASLRALAESVHIMPDYAPAVLSQGSVEYQRGRKAEGRRLFLSLFSISWDPDDLALIIDEAGSFLVDRQEYRDGLELYRAAVERFPDVASLYDGLGCCAGHEEQLEEAIAASERAVELDPEKQEYVSDLGWTLYLARRFEEAENVLARALVMDTSNELTSENLRLCQKALKGKRRPRTKKTPQARPRPKKAAKSRRGARP
jgi:tetratricopeptide (TPR) repeat protein